MKKHLLKLLFALLAGCSYFKTAPEQIPEETFIPTPASSAGFKDETREEKAKGALALPAPEEKVIETKQEETLIKRTVIALWDERSLFTHKQGPSAKILELPLNFLGLVPEYYDISLGLPDLSQRDDVLAVILWFPPEYPLKQINTFVRWAVQQIHEGKKLLLFGTVLDIAAQKESPLIEELWSLLGILESTTWNSFTYNFEVDHANYELYPFENSLPPILPPFLSLETIPDVAHKQMTLKSKVNPEQSFPVVITSKNGAFIYEEYFTGANSENTLSKYYLNPFVLLKLSLGLEPFPIPDPTTHCGRRIYYSQIDGDGWNNVTYALKENAVNPTLSSEMIKEKVISVHPDLPVTVGPIAADVDLKWFGTKKSRTIAEELFRMDNVEVGCHTFTHPFDWNFFKNYKVENELPFLSLYPTKTFREGRFSFLKNFIAKPSSYYSIQTEEDRIRLGIKEGLLEKGYVIPRAYALEPFDIRQEVLGAINEINTLAPEDKKVEIYQWSGNGKAFAEALKLTVEAKVQNINGANARLDFSFPSYGDLDAIGKIVGGYYQIFNSNSNENNYTELWTKNFFGFATLPNTLKWTETPLRVKPIDLYYHMYSGERLASLNAVLKNIEYIRSQKIIPVQTSLYTKFVDGFYKIKIVTIADQSWSLLERGELQTFRFDHAVFKGVDYEASEGILGARHLHGSLYVALDPEAENPHIVLKELEDGSVEPNEEHPYLIESSWHIRQLVRESSKKFYFQAYGFGVGEMVWHIPGNGSYQIQAIDGEGRIIEQIQAQAAHHILAFTLTRPELDAVTIAIQQEAADE